MTAPADEAVDVAEQGPAGGEPVEVDLRELEEDLHRVPRSFAVLLVVAGVLGLVAAFDLTVEKLRLLEDPSYVVSCDINPILSCQSIMTSEQAEVFGFPNPLIGLVSFGVLLTLGVLTLARTRLPGFVFDGLAIGGLLGLGFVSWLAFQSLYRIGALCPYCMVVWTVVVPVAVSSVLFTVRRRSATSSPRTFLRVDALWRWRWAITAVWYVTVAALILDRFWYYWRTLV